jgi:hypothetical protein
LIGFAFLRGKVARFNSLLCTRCSLNYRGGHAKPVPLLEAKDNNGGHVFNGSRRLGFCEDERRTELGQLRQGIAERTF